MGRWSFNEWIKQEKLAAQTFFINSNTQKNGMRQKNIHNSAEFAFFGTVVKCLSYK